MKAAPRHARDPVNLPIIENWLEAIGDDNPVYLDPEFAAASVHRGLVAPPAMIQVWTMNGQAPVTGSGGDPTGEMVAALDAAGYTSVVATNCDQVYNRYLRPGEQLDVRVGLTDLVGPKQTALGEGWFFTTRNTWYSGDEPVATMDFRILKFRAARGGTPPEPARVEAKPQPASGRAGPRSRDAAGDLAGHGVLLGRHCRSVSCASRAAGTAGRSVIRPARCAWRAAHRTRSTSSRLAPARCSATSCITIRRCPASSFRW